MVSQPVSMATILSDALLLADSDRVLLARAILAHPRSLELSRELLEVIGRAALNHNVDADERRMLRDLGEALLALEE